MQQRQYKDRSEAGHALAEELTAYRGARDAVVYGLARGGVPVAAVVARELGLPLEVLVVRKVGAPGNPELAAGAVTSVGGMVVNERVVRSMGVSEEDLDRRASAEREELESQSAEIHGDRERISPDGRTVLLVDDGLATGASMEAAVRATQESGARQVVVGVPVASSEAVERVRAAADAVHCLMTPVSFAAVGQWYVDFGQASNAQVKRLLEEAR